MREILFRGKRVDNGEWIQGDLLHDRFISSNEKIWRIYNEESKLTHREDVVIPETIGQYTGLTDKNGKKIFEGDIVAIVGEAKEMITEEQQIFVVKWQDEDCGFSLLCFFEYEVIGNIHDNPELLKGGAE